MCKINFWFWASAKSYEKLSNGGICWRLVKRNKCVTKISFNQIGSPFAQICKILNNRTVGGLSVHVLNALNVVAFVFYNANNFK